MQKHRIIDIGDFNCSSLPLHVHSLCHINEVGHDDMFVAVVHTTHTKTIFPLFLSKI